VRSGSLGDAAKRRARPAEPRSDEHQTQDREPEVADGQDRQISVIAELRACFVAATEIRELVLLTEICDNKAACLDTRLIRVRCL